MVYEIIKTVRTYSTKLHTILGDITEYGSRRFNVASAIQTANDDVEILVATMKGCKEVDKLIISRRWWKDGEDQKTLEKRGRLIVGEVTYRYDEFVFICKIIVQKRRKR